MWLLALAPTIWALHFLASYLTTAIACARLAGPDGALRAVPALLVGYTLLALAGLGGLAWRCARRRRPVPASARFLNRVGATLAGLSAVAVVYAGLPALFFASCR